MKIHGLYTAIVTPFTASLELDEEGLRENLRHQIAGGVDGITCIGTTGESPTLTHSEKEALISICLEECRGKTKVMVGTGSYSTKTAIENTRLARRLGADSALIVTPYYNKPTQEGLYLHFKAIADAEPDFPIVVYNIQGRTGQNIQTSTLARLAEIPNIVSVKEASGNVNQMMEVIEFISQKRPDFSVLSGDDCLTFPLMSLGGHGVISVVSNLLPKEISDLVRALQAGDYDRARALHYRLMPLFRTAFIETNPIPIKAAMRLMGFKAGGCRLPLCDLTPASLTALEKSLADLGFLTGALASW